MISKHSIPLILLLGSLLACSGIQRQQGGAETSSVNAPQETQTQLTPAPFDADSAYSFVETQVAFGHRTPGSSAHRQTGDWIVSKLRSWGYHVTEQAVTGEDYHKQSVRGRNIIATLSPDKAERIMLMAHWDTRAVADHDPEPRRRSEAILGADDGGSGVALLLELARGWRDRPFEDVAVDFVFFDLEDGGNSDNDNSWCQGSTAWAKTPHTPNYKAQYGILVDMVGAKGAKFYYEYHSKRYARPIMLELWAMARQLGWGEYFIAKDGSAAIDDHLPVIKHRGIPSVDIINMSPEGGFGPHWHTTSDDMRNIDKTTLRAVGETIATLIEQKHSSMR